MLLDVRQLIGLLIHELAAQVLTLAMLMLMLMLMLVKLVVVTLLGALTNMGTKLVVIDVLVLLSLLAIAILEERLVNFFGGLLVVSGRWGCS